MVLGALHPISDKALLYWGVACVISLVLFLFLFIPIVIAIEYCIKVVRSNSMESGTTRAEPVKADRQESHGNEYFQAISKRSGGTPIKSISQYRKVPKQASPPAKKPSPPPKAATQSPIKKQDSTGSEYFNQINRAGVKSISQYAALKKK